MARVAADTNDLRATASALRNAAGIYNEISILVANTVDPGSLPASMRGSVSAYEAQITGQARQLASKVAGESGALDRRAAMFDGVGGGGSLRFRFPGIWGAMLGGAAAGGASDQILGGLSSAFGWVKKTDRILQRAEGGLKKGASWAGRTLRTGHGKLQSLAGKWLRPLGQARKAVSKVAKPLRTFTKWVDPVFIVRNTIDTYQRTPGSLRQRIVSASIETVVSVGTKNPVVLVVDAAAGGQIKGAWEFQKMNHEFNYALATGDAVGAQQIAKEMDRRASAGDFGYPLKLYKKLGGQ